MYYLIEELTDYLYENKKNNIDLWALSLKLV